MEHYLEQSAARSSKPGAKKELEDQLMRAKQEIVFLERVLVEEDEAEADAEADAERFLRELEV